MSISLLEQETIILFNRSEDGAEIFTYEPTLKRKLDRMTKDFKQVECIKDNGEGGITYKLPKKFVAINRPKVKRELSEEEKQVRRERIAKARLSRKTL